MILHAADIGSTEHSFDEATQLSESQTKNRPGRPSISDTVLLDKAYDLFQKHGFERTSLSTIAAEAGIAKRTMYQRYPDKDALFRAALKQAIENWIVPLEKLRSVECEDFEQTLFNVGDVLIDNIMTHRGLELLRLSNAESGRAPEIAAFTYLEGTEPTVSYLSDLFEARLGRNSDSPGNWREAAIAFLFLVVCGPPTVALWGMPMPQAELAARTHYSIRLFLHGLLSRSEGEGPRNLSSQLGTADGAGSSSGEDIEKMTDDQVRVENRMLRNILVRQMLEIETLKGRTGS